MAKGKGYSVKVKVDNLNKEQAIHVAYEMTKAAKRVAPDSDVSVLGGTTKMFEGSSSAPELEEGK